MKVKMEFDVTPEETRRLLGLPDVSPVNDLLVERLRDQVEKGLDGTLLRNMMQSVIKGGAQGLDAYQTLLATIMGRARNGNEPPAEPPPPPPTDQGANTGPGNT
ncbi:MAG: hypothetical protein JJT88_01700 [Gammaproteobacteria bacterium]|nr:hypothetical protein [Gammaproteobacteria bacterium]